MAFAMSRKISIGWDDTFVAPSRQSRFFLMRLPSRLGDRVAGQGRRWALDHLL